MGSVLGLNVGSFFLGRSIGKNIADSFIKAEEIELKYLKIARAAESIADNLEPKISYVA